MAVAPLSETTIIKIYNVTMNCMFLNECFQFKQEQEIQENKSRQLQNFIEIYILVLLTYL